MAVTNYSTYVSAVSAPYYRGQDTKVALTTVVGQMSSMWMTAPDPGAAPTTAVVPTSATTGSMGQPDSTTASLYLPQVAASMGGSGYLLICDRLSHQGGLDGTVATAQTTNLPTAALTRYTSGVGVMVGLEVYSAVGATATTVTASYTNQAGTSGHTTVATNFGTTTYNKVGQIKILPLQQGDTGVQAVASVTLAATTGTVGNFGVTLFKPLFAMPIPNLGSQQLLFDGIQSMAGNIPEIMDGACLFYLVNTATTSTGVILTANRFIEA